LSWRRSPAAPQHRAREGVRRRHHLLPIGSLLRTSRDETGVVVRINPADPLHPVLTLLDESLAAPLGEVDTASRDASGGYERHIVETLRAREGLDLTRFLPAEPAEA
jgi:hypothetical protein